MTAIQHTKTLLYYDEPIVFEARDREGRHYLAMAIEPLAEMDRYLVVAVSPKQLRQLSTGGIDMRYLLLKAGKDAWFISTSTTGTKDPIVIERQRTPLEKSGLLPDAGFTLRRPTPRHRAPTPGARAV